MFRFVPYFLLTMDRINILKFLWQSTKYINKGKHLKFLSIFMIETASFWVYRITFQLKLIIC